MSSKLTPALKKNPADLALDQDDVGTRFMTLVVIMMTALATISVGGALIVQSMRGAWVGAISGHMTIEIPASDKDGIIRSPESLDGIAKRMRTQLDSLDSVRDAKVMPRKDVEDLVSPWLGEDAGKANLPLPALITLTLKNPGDKQAIEQIGAESKKIDATTITETHESWLLDLKRFSLVLLLAAVAMAAATIACSILTVAGAVKARLAAHHGDIGLLHVMGATDNYIGGQFVRIVVRDVGRAAIVGMFAGIVLLKIGGIVAGELQSTTLPQFTWNFATLMAFAALPALITGLCWGAARFTVLRTLRVMP